MVLNNKELQIIMRAIQKRIETMPLDKHGQPTNFQAHYNLLKQLLYKIDTSQNLSQKLKSLLQGIAKTEMMKEVEEFQNFVYRSSDVELFHIVKSHKTELDNLYLIEDLYNKIHGKQDAIKLTKDYLITFNILCNLPESKIYYSTSGDKIYKIGIPISSKQLVKIELDDDKTCSMDELQKNKNSYMHFGQKELLLQLLNNYSVKHSLTSRMLFVQDILTHNLKTA